MKALLVGFALLCTPLIAVGESVMYEVYAVGPNGMKELLVTGTADYSVKDVRSVKNRANDGTIRWDKSIALKKGFKIAVMVDREPSISGFGLTVGNEHWPLAFSWNWFDQSDGSTFAQLKGAGQVRIRTARIPRANSDEEIVSVEFLTDIVLTCTDNLLAHAKDLQDTHEVVIKKGSVLRVAE